MKKKYSLIFVVGISILLTYSVILYLNYNDISESIASHINIEGDITSYGNKLQLWIAAGVNLVLLIIIALSFKYPQIINFPNKPTDKVKLELFNEKAKNWMAYLSIFISIAFSSMVFYNLEFNIKSIFILFILIVILPVLFIEFSFSKKQ